MAVGADCIVFQSIATYSSLYIPIWYPNQLPSMKPTVTSLKNILSISRVTHIKTHRKNNLIRIKLLIGAVKYFEQFMYKSNFLVSPGVTWRVNLVKYVYFFLFVDIDIIR